MFSLNNLVSQSEEKTFNECHLNILNFNKNDSVSVIFSIMTILLMIYYKQVVSTACIIIVVDS